MPPFLRVYKGAGGGEPANAPSLLFLPLLVIALAFVRDCGIDSECVSKIQISLRLRMKARYRKKLSTKFQEEPSRSLILLRLPISTTS